MVNWPMIQPWVLHGLRGHTDIRGICDSVCVCVSFHFSPDQSERRSRTGLLYVSAVFGTAAKGSTLCVVVRVLPAMLES